MSNTFYIDANRQNSSVKSENNNEWTYKLSNNIQIPPQSEIGIEQVFIHKQGISGATIEIDEDITETLYFSVYVSDSPHFVPRATDASNAYDNRGLAQVSRGNTMIPSFFPFGLLNNRAIFNPAATSDAGNSPYFGQEATMDRIQQSGGLNHNGSKYYGYTNPAQRIALFEDDGGGNCLDEHGNSRGNNPRMSGSQFQNLNDPLITGYSECPMMAIFLDETSPHYTNTPELDFADAIGLRGRGTRKSLPDENIGRTGVLGDPRFKPYVKSVDIVIKRGVYSIGEISTLIENQINGKYVNVAEDDLYTDTIIDKVNSQTYEGTLETNAIYTKAQALDRFSLKKEHINTFSPATDFSAGPHMGINAAKNYQYPNVDLNAIFSQDGFFQIETTNGKEAVNSYNEPIDMFKHHNPTGLEGLHYAQFNDNYGLPFYPFDQKTIINYYLTNGSTTADGTRAVPTYALAYNNLPVGGNSTAYNADLPENTQSIGTHKGRQPIIPNKDQLFYIPVHYYNQMVKMWIHEDSEMIDFTTTREGQAHINSYLVETDNWTVNTRRIFRYGFQTRCNSYGHSVAPPNGIDMNDNDNFIGLHYFGKVNALPDFIQTGGKRGNPAKYPTGNEELCGVETTPANFQYDVMKDGYFVGTPDFSFSYDTDQSSFTIKGLHQSSRVSSCDMNGNPMTSEGESAVFLKRPSDFLETILETPTRTEATIAAFTNPMTAYEQEYVDRYNTNGGKEGFITKIKSVLNSNEDRVGGVAIYNWAYQTALKYGDIDPKTFKKKNPFTGQEYNPFNENYTHLWKYKDFFSSEELARQTWEKTLWFKLGFTYDNLQNEEGWEKVPYYDLPVDKYTNKATADALSTGDITTITASRRANTYYEHRNKMYFTNEDFRIYGKTTRGEIDLSSIPSISTTFNNLQYSYGERPTSGQVVKEGKSAGTIKQIIRQYNNMSVSKPYYGYTEELLTYGNGGGDNDNYHDPVSVSLLQNRAGEDRAHLVGAFDLSYSFDNSFYLGKTRTPILTGSKSIIASKLPRLSNQGYYLITSDIVDNYQDDLKQGQPLPLLGIVPISNLSNQDFIVGDSDIVHTTQQSKNINSIKIKILNPDLTNPILQENSSVVLKISTPLPQNTPMNGKNQKQKDPNDNNTTSGRN